MKIQFTHPALTFGEERVVYLVPATKVVCPTCGGTGSHVRQDIDDSRMVDSMIEDGDEDGLENYFRGGHDVVCTECHGKNVVDQIDYDWFRKNHPEEVAEIESWNESEREYRAEQRAERRALGIY